MPWITGALGAIVAAIIAASMALHTSNRHRDQMETERIEAKKRDDTSWRRQRISFKDQRRADKKMFKLESKKEAKAEVRGRAILHAERLIAPIGELRDLASNYNRFGAKTDQERGVRAREILDTMQVDVSYLDRRMRARLAILFRFHTAVSNIGQPGFVERPQGVFLRKIAEDTLENIMGFIRGESLAALTSTQSQIQAAYEAYVDYDEWLMDQAERSAQDHQDYMDWLDEEQAGMHAAAEAFAADNEPGPNADEIAAQEYQDEMDWRAAQDAEIQYAWEESLAMNADEYADQVAETPYVTDEELNPQSSGEQDDPRG